MTELQSHAMLEYIGTMRITVYINQLTSFYTHTSTGADTQCNCIYTNTRIYICFLKFTKHPSACTHIPSYI